MRDAETVTFGGSGLDRAAELRGDPERVGMLAAASEARFLVFWEGRPVLAGDRAGWLRADHPTVAASGPAVFLGLDDGAPRFAVDLAQWTPPEAPAGGSFDAGTVPHPDLEGAAFGELRGAMTWLSPRDAELAVTGRAVLAWHRSHGFCARCGSPSDVAMAGWQRICPACGAHHFPRTDPVVIMLVTQGNSVLVGRSPGWPEGMFSLLAGFVEPGETIEAAVRREVREETGVRVGRVSYLASQPWPFPASLMLGCRGEALTHEITLDPVEIEDARWLSREEMAEVMRGEHAEIRAARKGAIAHFLIDAWLSDRLG